MSRKSITLNVKTHNGVEWAQLSNASESQILVAESFSKKNENYSFIGGHRVRMFSLKKNVHWQLSSNVQTLDIAAVTPEEPMRRQVHNKKGK